jgi:hypothetical protein
MRPKTRITGLYFIALILLCATTGNAQFTDRYWTFGDSAAIDFSNLSNPVPSVSMLRSRGTCASICDSAGSLLFYCGSPQVPPWPSAGGGLKYGYVANINHVLMDNGDKLFGGAWYQEMIIIPDPSDINKFYVFTAGTVNPVHGLFYSVVDLTFNSGLGKVTQKNIQLRSDTLIDGITAIRHGNGRDWWLIIRNWKGAPLSTNEIYSYLISPTGISLISTQNIGYLLTNESQQRCKFNIDGSKLYSVAVGGAVQRYDFDRCTGLFSNFVGFAPQNNSLHNYWGFEVSPDESKIYTTSIYNTANQDSSFLFQFDLNAPNYLASVDTLGVFVAPATAGILQKGPDDKIYLSVTWAGADACNDYLYCYSTVNTTNSNISVINNPDSAGAACDFQPFSFYLGGHKAYWGLPNNPNYELGALVGSPCDTLSVGINEVLGYNNGLSIFFDPSWKIAFVNAKGLKGKQYKLEIFNLAGQLVLEENGKLDSEYYTSDVALTAVGNGMYVVRLSTEKEILTGKFVKY